jgi:phospholipid/cholesterol/gamma-HCH transport system substrate-binding protein
VTRTRTAKVAVAAALVLALVGGIAVMLQSVGQSRRTHVVAYFDNSNGIFNGDEVRILGVPVGKVEQIQPEAGQVKITFWFDDKYKVPAEANAAILSPSLVSARAIQLTPAYKGGPTMGDNTVIPRERTAVPVEWDDFREQLKKLTTTLQPTEPGGVSTLGAFVNTAADNLRGQGTNIRDTVIKLSQAFSAVGDHSDDIFSTVKNLSKLVSALQSSADLMSQLNINLAAVTALLSNDSNEIATAISDLNTAVTDVQSFVADNREALGITSDKLASVSTALVESLDDVKQTLHIAPTSLSNFVNIYQPAQAALTGIGAINNFANPVSFICGSIQAASRMNFEQSAKLCAQYLAPIVKNRQYNFPPLGVNVLVGTQARPNEVTYSEDWMRPDYIPPQGGPGAQAPPGATTQGPPQSADTPPLAAEAPVATDPADGLTGMMVPPGGGS